MDLPSEHTVVEHNSFYSKPKNLIALLIGVLLIGSIIGVGLFARSTSPTPEKNDGDKQSPSKFIANYAAIYGAWDPNGSKIYAYDLTTNSEYLLATLPLEVKKVSLLSDDKLIFINKTNIRDYGEEIAVYDLASKEITPLYTADNGFGIDDYVLSENKQYIAFWELQVDAASGTVMGGQSRVYTARTNSTTKNQIFNETATEDNPVRYPRGILNNGTVFVDRFLPNNGAGWAYGMEIAEFSGTNKRVITGMENGTYSSQPTLSPNGKYFAFAGYDQSKGSGTQLVNGFRRALIYANTVELLDTQSLARQKLENLPASNLYSEVRWNSLDDLFITVASSAVNKSGIFNYSLTSKVLDTQNLKDQEKNITLYELSDELSLTGIFSFSESVQGNLGSEYSKPISQLSIFTKSTGESTRLSTENNLLQLIALVPSPQFSKSTFPITGGGSDKNIQIKTFYVKTELEENREKQQTDPPPEVEPTPTDRPTTGIGKPDDDPDPTPKPPSSQKPACRDLYAEQVMAACGAEPPKPPPGASPDEQKTQYEKRSAWNQCLDSVLGPYYGTGVCAGSPLYLYGTPGQQVTVKIHTPIYNSNVAYNNGFQATIIEDNKLQINNTVVNSIAYDYQSALRSITPPTKGYVINRHNFDSTIRTIARRLQMNKMETQDLVSYVSSHMTEQHAFVSLFDHDMSHAILPITFDPQPDHYRNIVFYIKNLKKPLPFTPVEPPLTPIIRGGFTAVEISGIVD